MTEEEYQTWLAAQPKHVPNMTARYSVGPWIIQGRGDHVEMTFEGKGVPEIYPDYYAAEQSAVRGTDQSVEEAMMGIGL